LFAFLPLFFSAFAIAAPLIFLARFRAVLKRNVIAPAELIAIYNSAEQWTYILTAVALATGFIVAYAVVRPARRLLMEAQEEKDVEEFSSLGKEFTKIAASLKNYTALIESTTGGVLTADKTGTITMVHPYACYILGQNEVDLIGENIGTLLNIAGDLQAVLRGKTVTAELFSTIKGEDKAIGYTLSPIKSGHSIEGVVFNFMDNTRINEMYREMQRTEKLANVGTLALEVAHEIRNPLASIKGLLQLIREDMDNDDQKKLYIDTILKETERLNRVVDTIFEKKTAVGEEDNLRDIIHRILLLCNQIAKDKAVKIVEDYDGATGKILVKDERFFHALYNIVLNAYEAVEKDGEIAIKTMPAAGGISVEVCSDSELGIGIDADAIFETDVTTKGKGRGMGLKIARDAIKNIGGHIKVETAGGKTKFVLWLPWTDK